MSIQFEENESSLLSGFDYSTKENVLVIYFKKYYVDSLEFHGVDPSVVYEFIESKSKGKFYLNQIKSKFKARKMNTEKKRKSINKASSDTREIFISIDVKKINKDWLHVGEKGTYLKLKFRLMPDGTVDKYGNLGMVTQEVPKSVWEPEKESGIPIEERTKSIILGNGVEFEKWKPVNENVPGSEEGAIASSLLEPLDDLPF